MASIPMGICPKCGTKRKGHALRIPRYQTCPKCGEGLEITEDGKYMGSGFSPFTADEINIKSKEEIPKIQGTS
jgi:ribosomal protein L32